jgi:WbqC-like protein
MIAAIHQPQFLPWLGYFDKMDKADVFCYLDNVQFKKNEWQNRNRIKTGQGWQWITVPVQYRFPQKISEVPINNTANWQKKHLQALRTNYSKAKFFEVYFAMIEEAYAQPWRWLSDLNIYLAEKIRHLLGLGGKKTVKASDFDLSEEPTQRLIDLCRAVGANTYLSGREGPAYMDMSRFEESGIDMVVQAFDPPEYSQLFGAFESHLSVVDLLFNCGPASLDRIRESKTRGGI